MVFVSPLWDVCITGFGVLYILLISCLDAKCDVVFLELARFGVERVDVVALWFLAPKRVTRPEDSMNVTDVDNLETVFPVSDER